MFQKMLAVLLIFSKFYLTTVQIAILKVSKGIKVQLMT